MARVDDPNVPYTIQYNAIQYLYHIILMLIGTLKIICSILTNIMLGELSQVKPS